MSRILKRETDGEKERRLKTIHRTVAEHNDQYATLALIIYSTTLLPCLMLCSTSEQPVGPALKLLTAAACAINLVTWPILLGSMRHVDEFKNNTVDQTIKRLHYRR